MRRFLFSAALFLAVISAQVLAGQSGRQCIAEHYKLIALPLRPARINDSGQVAGTTPAHHAALWSEKEGQKQIGLPAGFELAEGLGLNTAGHLIGVATNNDASKRHAFIFQDGKLTLLSGEQSKPNAIDDADEIAGESAVSRTSKRARRTAGWTRSSSAQGGPTDL